ncbi:MAG TPA: molybdopterin cofactor-binding domain-containing protein [Allosphingosinicella sp.]|jgi:isoquinoline 1-oxidoreductase beta subunit|nr:molybdopterin cofactor-binding domain-containing protein [Allosphingosinicella sp.]
MARGGETRGISRRTLLVGGGAGAGLLVAWALWPRSYGHNLRAGEGEQAFNAFLKIGNDGRVLVAVPQAELGQGSWTALAQILADELGADWRTVGVEPAPIGPLYANRLLASGRDDGSFAGGARRWRAQRFGSGEAAMLTAGSTSVRAFERPLREAGAGARALLMKAAAARWGVEWDVLDTAAGFVLDGRRRLRFADLAESAAGEDLPEHLPIRAGIDNRLAGQPLPRLDLPAKVDGSAPFAGDIRLADMVYASVRAGPTEDSRLARWDKAKGLAVPGVFGAFDAPGWVACLASNWWAANRGVEALEAVWDVPHPPASSAGVDSALAGALERDEGRRTYSRGDLADAFGGGTILRGHYRAGPAASAPLETLTATARPGGDRLEIWAPTQAPGLARAAAARVAGLGEAQVTLYPTMVGGGYGRKLETRAIEQAAMLAMRVRRPVQLSWSRIEETVQDGFRAPARAQLLARIDTGGIVLGWQARIAAPDTGAELAARLPGGEVAMAAIGDPVAGAVPPYAIPAVAVDHLAADTGIRTGAWRSGAHSYTAFFTESFIDELARLSGVEPLSFRMQMLGDNPRLARCLTTAATLGGWDGGVPGSSMGIACHSAFGSHVAALVEVEVTADQRARVLRAVCAVDCGRIVNPEIVKQQIEGGLIFGIAAATGRAIGFERGRPDARGFGHLGFPGLADSPEISVELLDSDEEPGGVTELGVPVAAPAVANALHALTGRRLRSLPLVVGG